MQLLAELNFNGYVLKNVIANPAFFDGGKIFVFDLILGITAFVKNHNDFN